MTKISLEGNNGGATILVFGLFLFSIQDLIIKYFSDHYSVLQIVFIRCVIASLLMLIVIWTRPSKIPLMATKPIAMLTRGLLGFSSYLCYYMAVAAMPLAEVVSITFTMPLFVTALSAIILKENVGIRRWSAVFVGFIGVLIIIQPGGEFNGLAVFLAFLASITYASHTIITRILGSDNDPLTLSFNTLAIFTIASGILSILVISGMINIESAHPSLAFFGREWASPTAVEWGLLIAIAFIAAIGFFCLTKAYCIAEASAISPFEFTYILWAVIFGYIFWSEVPKMTTYIGIAILVASNLYISYRERKVSKIDPESEQIVALQQ